MQAWENVVGEGANDYMNVVYFNIYYLVNLHVLEVPFRITNRNSPDVAGIPLKFATKWSFTFGDLSLS